MSPLFIVILALWLIVLLRSVKRGFIKTLLGIVLFFVFIGGVRALTAPVGHELSESAVVSEWAEGEADTFIRNRIADLRSGDAAGSIWAAVIPLPEGALSEGTGLIIDAVGEDAVVAPLIKPVSEVIIRLLTLALAVLLSLIAVIVIGIIIGQLSKDREFSGVDHLLGLVPGFVKAAVYSWLILAAVRAIIGLGGSGLETQITSSAFLSALDKSNPFLHLLG